MSKKKKRTMNEDQMKKCNAIIHGASVAAGGVGTGMAQIPLADNAVITPIQIGMIIALGKVFDQEISKSAATAILGGMTASFVGRGISQVLVGWIPGVGNAINTATAAGVTEAIGWAVADNFSKNQYEEYTNNDSNKEKETVPDENRRVDESTVNALKQRADEFFSGRKNKKADNDEYKQLLNDFDKVLLNVPDGDPLYEIYDKL